MPKQSSRLKVGDICYIKDVGFPFDREGDHEDSWEGASVVVLELGYGHYNDLIRVGTLLPMRAGRRHPPMRSCAFSADVVRKENRPWLRKHIRQIIKLRDKLKDFVHAAEQML